jgi:hypothetical protein
MGMAIRAGVDIVADKKDHVQDVIVEYAER